eukprot:4947742-Alexandrium_andersonii.AAC.1
MADALLRPIAGLRVPLHFLGKSPSLFCQALESFGLAGAPRRVVHIDFRQRLTCAIVAYASLR